MNSSHSTLAVIGAGSWGTALAWLLVNNTHQVRLWTRRPAHAEELKRLRENKQYLPGLMLPESLDISTDLHQVMNGVEAAIIAVPSKGLRAVLEQLPDAPAFISTSKGLEAGSFERFTQIIHEYKPKATLAALSGPNLAKEIAQSKLAAATIASEDEGFAQRAQHWFNQATFRVYTSKDLIGVEVAGALKNIMALAAGMCDGLALGANAKAAIITRGLAEIIRIGTHLGGQEKTFYGLAGLGDMIATCSSISSRNYTAGERLAKGASLVDSEISQLTAEGIPTVKAVYGYAQEHGLELPIAHEIYQVIYEQKSPQKALEDLMKRDLKAE